MPMIPARTTALLASFCLGFAASATAATVVFKDGGAVLSSDGLINITDYQGTEDTSLVQESSNQNYGGRPTILVGVIGSGRVRCGLIRYDLTSMAGLYQNIDSMTLRLYVDTKGGTSQVMGVGLEQEGNADWVEGTLNGVQQSGSACWNYAQWNTVSWLGGANGARGAADLYGTLANVPLNDTVAPAGTWVEIPLDPSSLPTNVDSLTEIVNLWADNSGADNAGIHLTYGSPSGNPQWQFASSETADASHAPELVIEYTPVPEPSAAALAALMIGAAGFLRRRRS